MLKAKHITGLVFFPAFDWAIDKTHPEREERLLYTQDQVFEEGLLDIEGIHSYLPDIASLSDIQRVHFCVPNEISVATQSHLISAGGAKRIAQARIEGEIERGFAIVRPPGHHAMRVVHGSRGFCNINIEAIMVEFLREKYGVRRVAIVDTDCHHGDGTQDIYWHDPDTLFISLHQDGRTIYPGTGTIKETGGPASCGTIINLPLPPHTGTEGFLYAAQHVILPAINDFKPELIINSAGQDNHFSDPITQMGFTAQGYAKLTELLKADLAILEGGYAIEGALPYTNLGIILAMAGLDYSYIIEPCFDEVKAQQSAEITEHVKKICEISLVNWKNRKNHREQFKSNAGFFERTRDIFYDTDNIHEVQHERLKDCLDCPGFLLVDSETDTKRKIRALHIPRQACGNCIDMAFSMFENTPSYGYEKVFLQNRTTDQYLVRP